jgi:hypothetical protein
LDVARIIVRLWALRNWEDQSKPTPQLADRIVVREENRELCADLVKVQWKSEAGFAQSEWAILEDISPSGACLAIEKPISPDMVVSLQFANDRCQARIKYCKFDKVNYLLGVQFEQGYRWSRRKFKPDHLIQFRLHRVRKSK